VRGLALATPFAAAFLTAGCAHEEAINVHASGTGAEGAPCMIEIGGQRIALAEVAALARRWRGREAHLTMNSDTSYRCVGSLIYELQKAGLRRIGFISEPALPPLSD
jgi:hypothetical protein